MQPAMNGLTNIPPAAVAGTVPFLLLVAAIVLVSCAVAALAGFGGNLLALPFLAWVCGDLWLAVVLLLLLGMTQSLVMATATLRHVRWRPLAELAAWSAIGIPVGLLCVSRLPQRPLMILMGLVILAGGLAGFASVTARVDPRPFRLRDRVLLLVAGVMHGAFGCGGPTVVLAARRVLPEKQAFRATLFVFWLLLNGFALVGVAARRTTPGLPLLLAVGLPCMLLGSWAGHRLARGVSQRRFGELVAGLLAVTGLVTIVRAW
jgi:hypothetical protein